MMLVCGGSRSLAAWVVVGATGEEDDTNEYEEAAGGVTTPPLRSGELAQGDSLKVLVSPSGQAERYPPDRALFRAQGGGAACSRCVGRGAAWIGSEPACVATDAGGGSTDGWGGENGWLSAIRGAQRGKGGGVVSRGARGGVGGVGGGVHGGSGGHSWCGCCGVCAQVGSWGAWGGVPGGVGREWFVRERGRAATGSRGFPVAGWGLSFDFSSSLLARCRRCHFRLDWADCLPRFVIVAGACV